MSILIWSLAGLLVYSFILVPFFMELALDKPKKTEDGKLRIKSNGFVIRYLYWTNVRAREKKNRLFPKNTCRLYKGIYGGILCFFLIPSFAFILLAVFFVLFYVVAGPFAFIAGFMPNPIAFVQMRINEYLFYPYEKIGDKKWIAPWKFILPIGLVAFVYFFYKFYKENKDIFTDLIKMSHHLSSKTAVIVYGSIAGLIFLIIIVNKIKKTESFAATKETVISFIKKMCKEVELT